MAAYIRQREMVRAGDRIGLAVSGGADSVALLRLMLELAGELGLVLSVVHFHHKIRGAEADADQRFVAELAQQYRLPLRCGCGDAPAYAASQRLSLETAARQLRYQYFSQVLGSGAVTKIATAHTLDDQAETVLLRLIRGAGTRGLAGIYPKLPVANEAAGIIRPLLGIRRTELEDYLRDLHQDWREDASNRDLKHDRNRVRHRLLPLLETEFNPAIRQVLADTAEIARAEEQFWASAVKSFNPEGGRDAEGQSRSSAILPVKVLARQSLALQRRIVRAVAQELGMNLDFQQLEAVLQLVHGTGSALDLPEGWQVCRRRPARKGLADGEPVIAFERGSAETQPSAYEYNLPIPGEVVVTQTGKRISARLVDVNQSSRGDMFSSGYNCQLLDPLPLGSVLRVRNWRPGDRFWPAHTKSPRKVKELLQGRHISGRERALWPVATVGDKLVWMRGFPVPAQFAIKPESAQAVEIAETDT